MTLTYFQSHRYTSDFNHWIVILQPISLMTTGKTIIVVGEYLSRYAKIRGGGEGVSSFSENNQHTLPRKLPISRLSHDPFARLKAFLQRSRNHPCFIMIILEKIMFLVNIPIKLYFYFQMRDIIDRGFGPSTTICSYMEKYNTLMNNDTSSRPESIIGKCANIK